MDEALLQFFTSLDRSLFLGMQYKGLAKLDRPLPIGLGQTISQPSLVLYMTQQLDLKKNQKVLEIGTGSGYQSAFLAEFCAELYTVELLAELQKQAKERLRGLGYHNIHYKVGDGSLGWAEHAPYDRIMVTAAAKRMPLPLIEQLAPGGIMIIPVGPLGWQELMQVTKDSEGNIEQKKLLDVAFVELVGKYS
ncbi:MULTISPECIES: protein-L-isoaspartate(D-aspartate) O-methyltransferase [Sphaerochaeta]|jgi:protein-L-isoaspartate(D-aspartate) O-methyltransferase|uniref:Protein-L-isoaspartate O-methyltransferase n=1 Tax=Sphaerochaeta associata TaxID=1129264 RepID=A0ABY4DDD1_9SPIR|nr:MULTISPECIES: protein-L-isoaspartate(D-aspartate) O-methyltransferase [Sphaerochaeta]MDX9984358.1 protein-L-isoaspartate(D-aspartate) O-methyltransferase [Sphaerochaeta sp.]NLA97138.1 protein-L-isoaspartate(D-aspartate) O-methyltransferase [Spirochaetales bacterium]UOM51493.1 protein-L-isoaspartate(D-aspartate) O-methyltransferase [Sphaerochaeta associata]SMP61746.1 protein-L-isoaspartate(D-aspartate) O-methyltransferase [Sphaerochaeta associata]